MGQIIELGYGKANLDNTLATFAAMKVTAPFVRVSGATSGTARGGGQHSVGRHEHTGVLLTKRVEHDNGTVILLQVSWKRGGAGIRDGSLFLRLRPGAPLYQIKAKVPTGRENVYGDRFTMFSGYADIMDEHDFASAGLHVNDTYARRFMSLEELEECYDISIIAPETQPRPSPTSVSTPTGVAHVVMAEAPARRINLRRRS